jgi:hypothetical protein
MEELLLMNPSQGKGSRSFQIVFPRKIKKLRANEGEISNYAARKLPMIGINAKQAVGGIAGAGLTIAVPKYLKLNGWKDVAASGLTAVVGGGLARGMDRDAGEAFLYTGLGVTGLKAVLQLVKTARGQTGRRTRRSLADEKGGRGRRTLNDVEDLTDEDLDRLLGELNDSTDLFGALGSGIEDLGQEVVLS